MQNVSEEMLCKNTQDHQDNGGNESIRTTFYGFEYFTFFIHDMNVYFKGL